MSDPSGGEEAPGLVACQLTLAAAAARPGDTVTALLQVSCSQPVAVELEEVQIDFSGIERIDTSWVQPAYRRDTPPINADKRKVQRYVVQSRLQAATQGTFSDLTLRRFVIRFTLPTWLPPTFRGTAVRYLYYLQAVIKHRPARLQGQSGGSGSNGTAAAQPAGGVATRIPLHIWPAKSEEMPIKCWEIGPGTAVQDAVAHIAKLAAQPAHPSRPHSPAGALGRGGAPPSMGLLGAACSAGGEDSRSEISHDPKDAEQAEELQPSPGAGGNGSAAAPAAPPRPPLEAQGEQGAAAAASGADAPPGKQLPGHVRRPSLTRPSLDGGARSPAAPADSGATLRSFALRIGDQPLVRVSLHPPLEGSLQPGSTLTGTLDFSPQPPAAAVGEPAAAAATAAGPSPRCVQVLILLETEEAVEAPWRRQVQGGGAAIRRVFDEHLELTADTACTHFIFSIPPDAAASFQTPLVQLRWLLRFQFTASLPPAGAAGQHAEWNPLHGRLEQLAWALPVMVAPPP